MKFSELKPGDVFRAPHAGPDIQKRIMMKVCSDKTHLNAVYIHHWHAGTLDVMHDNDVVVKLYSTHPGYEARQE